MANPWLNTLQALLNAARQHTKACKPVRKNPQALCQLVVTAREAARPIVETGQKLLRMNEISRA
jgi:hypothetical protein